MNNETPTQAARRICPNWMSPTGDAHYRDVLCPTCQGTGKYPHQTEDAPSHKCTECNGTGEAQHFEMIFWSYDQFPYVLASRGFLRDYGAAYVPSYNACFRPVKVMSLADGTAVKDTLRALEQERRVALEALEKSYRDRLRSVAPWAVKD